ncbi:MAG: thiol:disulfide interchange protein, partial [Muribaculaceae bacterium]|nr:thiol:disulfide interchange protein [Muribaculaceae bacterium]
MKKYFLTFALVVVAVSMWAADAVSWSMKLVGDNTDHPAVEITATVAPGYHMYAVENPPGGSNPLEFFFDVKGCKLDGKPKANKAYTKEFDDVFEVDQYFYDGKVTFTQKLIPTAPDFSIDVELKGQACNDSGCVPLFASQTFKGKAPVAAKATETETKPEVAPENTVEQKAEEIATMTDSLQANTPALTPGANLSGINAPEQGWWANVEAELKVFEDNPEQQGRSLWYIFLAGFIGGLIALVTPCVWPMIPMTVSFFLKQNKSRSKSIAAATTYGASIIVIYV